MRNRAPSPLVPFLMVGALWLLICGPTLLSLLGSLVILFVADSEGRFTFSIVMVLLTLLLLVLIQWPTVLFPGRRRSMYFSSAVQQTSSSGYDGGGFGLGTLIMVVLYFILCSLVWGPVIFDRRLLCTFKRKRNRFHGLFSFWRIYNLQNPWIKCLFCIWFQVCRILILCEGKY